MHRLLLIGNYGVGNFGDELLRAYFLDAFSAERWTVVTGGATAVSQESGDVAVVPRLPLGPRSLLTTPWWKTISAFWHTDAVIFGGGSLFTDTESLRAPILWWMHAFVGWLFRKPIILAFQGIGPVRSSVARWCTAWVVRHASCIVVRDDRSAERVREWTKSPVTAAYDPVIKLLSLHSFSLRVSQQGSIAIIPRANATEAFLQACRNLPEEGATLQIVSFCPDDPAEVEICNLLARERSASVIPVRSLQDLLTACSGISHILTQRYHGAVAALGLGIPFLAVPQAPGDKLSQVAAVNRDEACRRVVQGEEVLRSALNRIKA